MALHPDFAHSTHAALDPYMRWFPADKGLRENCGESLMTTLYRKVKAIHDGGYVGAPGRCKIVVKVTDIFGNDTMTIVGVNVGWNRHWTPISANGLGAKNG